MRAERAVIESNIVVFEFELCCNLAFHGWHGSL
jgi:hypothetical protein